MEVQKGLKSLEPVYVSTHVCTSICCECSLWGWTNVPCFTPRPFLMNLFLLAGSCFADGIDASMSAVWSGSPRLFVCPFHTGRFVAGRKSRLRNVWIATSGLSVYVLGMFGSAARASHVLIGLKLDEVKNQFRLESNARQQHVVPHM